jgi:hypothetical protein
LFEQEEGSWALWRSRFFFPCQQVPESCPPLTKTLVLTHNSLVHPSPSCC